MIFSDDLREKMFESARALDPTLGALFQNPMNVVPNDLWIEITEARRLKEAEMRRYDAYIERLGVLLSFPERAPSGKVTP